MKALFHCLWVASLALFSTAALGADGRGGSGVELLAVGMVFGTPILITLIISYYDFHTKRTMFATIDKAIETGTEVPQSVLDAIDKPRGQASSLKKGLVWMGLGLGILLAWTLFRNFQEASLGLIPLFVGVAYTLMARLEPDTDATA